MTLTKQGEAKLDAALIDHAANEVEIVGLLDPTQREQLTDLLRTFHLALTVTADPDQRV